MESHNLMIQLPDKNHGVKKAGMSWENEPMMFRFLSDGEPGLVLVPYNPNIGFADRILIAKDA